jgi:membrane-associated phospholipid phosphatase
MTVSRLFPQSVEPPHHYPSPLNGARGELSSVLLRGGPRSAPQGSQLIMSGVLSKRERLLWLVTRRLSLVTSSELTFSFRVEDVIALLFFSINILLELVFRGLRGKALAASDIMIVIPAVALILAKQAADYLIEGHVSAGRGHDTLDWVRPGWRVFRDWFPFLLILLMYYSMWGRATLLLFSHDRDAMLLNWDKWLFGIEPTIYLQRIISRPLTAWMQFSYTFHLYVMPIVAMFIYVSRPRSRFREMTCGLVVISFIGAFGYMIVPAIGPMYTLHNLYTTPLSQPLAVFNRQIRFIDIARVSRDCFPSLHVGISFLIWLYAWRNSKILFAILAPFILSCWLSTVYLRFHYAADCLAGFALAPLCFLLANWLYKRFGEVTFRVPVHAVWAEPGS